MSGASPPVADALLPHRHLDRVEAFWVLDSTAEFDLTAPPAQPAPGPSSSSPAASPTPFGAAADDDPHLLVLHAPALDGYFRDLDRLWSGPEPPSREDELDVMRRRGTEPA